MSPIQIQWFTTNVVLFSCSQVCREFAIGLIKSGPSLGFPLDSAGKESACNAGDLGQIPGLGRPPGEGNGSSILAWRIPRTVQSWGHKELDTTERLSLSSLVALLQAAEQMVLASAVGLHLLHVCHSALSPLQEVVTYWLYFLGASQGGQDSKSKFVFHASTHLSVFSLLCQPSGCGLGYISTV